MTTTSYKLTYFDARALGEPIRYIFKAAGVDFEDVRVGREEWPQLKASTPFGHMPLLEFDGQTYAECRAICRYLGSQFDLMPNTDVGRLRADILADAVNDAMEPITGIFKALVAGDMEMKEKLIKQAENDFLVTLANLEKFLPDTGFIGGDKMSWADIFFASCIEFFVAAGKYFGFNINLDKYPKINAIKDQVFCDNKIAAYRESRPTHGGSDL